MGEEEWYKDGQLHREDGPAIAVPNSGQYWYQNNQRHREDGPAIIRPDGTEEWYKDGQLHRDSGQGIILKNTMGRVWYPDPAVTNPDGSKAWYREGVKYQSEDADGRKLWYGRDGQAIADLAPDGEGYSELYVGQFVDMPEPTSEDIDRNRKYPGDEGYAAYKDRRDDGYYG